MAAVERRLSARLKRFFKETAADASRQIYANLPHDAIGKAASGKVRRDAFLYLDPSGDADRFAQCGTCKEYLSNGDCYLFASPVDAYASCGLYVPGRANPDWISDSRLVTPEEAGYVDRQVRCENCRFFDGEASICDLYADLNQAFPNVFELGTQVDAKGCCNAQTPMALSKGSDHPGGADLHVLPKNAISINLAQKYPGPVTRANLWHIAWAIVHDGQFAPKRAVIPLDTLIPTQEVVDKERVAKHEAALLAGEGVEPDQKPPLALSWANGIFLLGGHHGTQAARNLGVREMVVDLMVAPD